MRRILYIEPVGHVLFSNHFATLLHGLAAPTVQIEVAHLSLNEPVTSPFLPASPAYQGALFNRVRQAEADGYDGVIIGCSSDPGLREARRSVGIPVVGPFVAALYLAALRAERVGVITPGPRSEVIWLWDCARAYGLAHAVAEVVIAEVGHPPEDERLARRMREDPGGVRDEILAIHRQSVQPGGAAMEMARRLVAEQGVGALVFACTFWGGMLEPIRQAVAVTAIDPCAAPLRLVEALVESSPPARGKAR